MIKGTATGYLDLSDKLVAAATGRSLTAVAVNNGGSGYVVGDVLTVDGGTSTVVATVEVTAVSGGAITGVRVMNQGVYTADPSTPNSATGGSGTGASITLTMEANGWTANRDSTWSGSEKEVMLEGEGDGSDAIHVAWRTFSGSGYANWELHGLVGYTAGAPMDTQPGVSPGFHDNSDLNQQSGAYLVLADLALEYWFFITSQRIIGVVRVGTGYFNFYLGWGNRFATESEYPYPMIVAGCVSDPWTSYTSSMLKSGLIDPWQTQEGGGRNGGPMFVRHVDGTWYTVANGQINDSNNHDRRTERVYCPPGYPDGATHPYGMPYEDQWTRLDPVGFQSLMHEHQGSGTPDAYLMPVNGVRTLVPGFIVFTEPSHQILAELDAVWWVSAYGGLLSEDRVIIDDVAYRVFQNCNRTEVYSYLAIREI
jgi:hypothetical protein